MTPRPPGLLPITARPRTWPLQVWTRYAAAYERVNWPWNYNVFLTWFIRAQCELVFMMWRVCDNVTTSSSNRQTVYRVCWLLLTWRLAQLLVGLPTGGREVGGRGLYDDLLVVIANKQLWHCRHKSSILTLYVLVILNYLYIISFFYVQTPFYP